MNRKKGKGIKIFFAEHESKLLYYPAPFSQDLPLSLHWMRGGTLKGIEATPSDPGSQPETDAIYGGRGQKKCLNFNTVGPFALRREDMPREKSPDQMRILVAEIAQRVFLLHEPRNEVAHHLGVHKSTISRLLNQAKEQGIYTIHMNLPRIDDLEVRLNRRFGVDSVVVPVVPPSKPQDHVVFTRVLGEAAARYLEGPASPLKSGQVVGISCGATIRDLVFSLSGPQFTAMKILQLTVETETGGAIDQSPFTLVSVLRAKWSDKETKAFAVQPLPGTLYKVDGEPCSEYIPCRKHILELAECLDVAIIGISSGVGGSFGQILRKGDIDDLQVRRLHIVGEIVNHPYNREGKDLFDEITNLKRYVDGVGLDILRRLVSSGKKVVAVAGGNDKLTAIQVALQTGIVSNLVTDLATAEALCSHPENSLPRGSMRELT